MRLVPLVGQLSDHKLACAPPASTAGNLADSMLLTHRETLQRHIAARLREQHEEKDLLMEPVRSMLYFKTGMAIDQLVYLLTRQADAAKKGQSLPYQAGGLPSIPAEVDADGNAARRGGIKRSVSNSKRTASFAERTSAAAAAIVVGGGAVVRRMLSFGGASSRAMVAPMLLSPQQEEEPLGGSPSRVSTSKSVRTRALTAEQHASRADRVHRKAGNSLAARIMGVSAGRSFSSCNTCRSAVDCSHLSAVSITWLPFTSLGIFLLMHALVFQLFTAAR